MSVVKAFKNIINVITPETVEVSFANGVPGGKIVFKPAGAIGEIVSQIMGSSNVGSAELLKKAETYSGFIPSFLPNISDGVKKLLSIHHSKEDLMVLELVDAETSEACSATGIGWTITVISISYALTCGFANKDAINAIVGGAMEFIGNKPDILGLVAPRLRRLLVRVSQDVMMQILQVHSVNNTRNDIRSSILKDICSWDNEDIYVPVNLQMLKYATYRIFSGGLETEPVIVCDKKVAAMLIVFGQFADRQVLSKCGYSNLKEWMTDTQRMPFIYASMTNEERATWLAGGFLFKKDYSMHTVKESSFSMVGNTDNIIACGAKYLETLHPCLCDKKVGLWLKNLYELGYKCVSPSKAHFTREDMVVYDLFKDNLEQTDSSPLLRSDLLFNTILTNSPKLARESIKLMGYCGTSCSSAFTELICGRDSTETCKTCNNHVAELACNIIILGVIKKVATEVNSFVLNIGGKGHQIKDFLEKMNDGLTTGILNGITMLIHAYLMITGEYILKEEMQHTVGITGQGCTIIYKVAQGSTTNPEKRYELVKLIGTTGGIVDARFVVAKSVDGLQLSEEGIESREIIYPTSMAEGYAASYVIPVDVRDNDVLVEGLFLTHSGHNIRFSLKDAMHKLDSSTIHESIDQQPEHAAMQIVPTSFKCLGTTFNVHDVLEGDLVLAPIASRNGTVIIAAYGNECVRIALCGLYAKCKRFQIKVGYGELNFETMLPNAIVVY